MGLEGRVWKSGELWFVESPAFEVSTQGASKEEAIDLLCKSIVDMARYYFPPKGLTSFKVIVHQLEDGVLDITATNEKLLIGLSQRCQKAKV